MKLALRAVGRASSSPWRSPSSSSWCRPACTPGVARSSTFAVRHVRSSGRSASSQKARCASWDRFVGRNLFAVGAADVATRSELARLSGRRAKVDRHFPSTLVVRVREYRPRAVRPLQGPLVPALSDDGHVLAELGARSARRPRRWLAGRRTPSLACRRWPLEPAAAAPVPRSQRLVRRRPGAWRGALPAAAAALRWRLVQPHGGRPEALLRTGLQVDIGPAERLQRQGPGTAGGARLLPRPGT